MLFCIAPAPATMPVAQLRLAEVKHCVEGALHDVGWSHKDLAAAMGFGSFTRIGLYYRQLRTHGLNFNLLLNADPAWVLAFIVRICRLLGITNEQVAKAFGIDIESEQERRQKDEAIERRLRRLEELAGVPVTDTDPPAEEADADENLAMRRVDRRRDDSDGGGEGQATAASTTAAAGADRVDLPAVHLSVQGRQDLPDPVVVRVRKEL